MGAIDACGFWHRVERLNNVGVIFARTVTAAAAIALIYNHHHTVLKKNVADTIHTIATSVRKPVSPSSRASGNGKFGMNDVAAETDIAVAPMHLVKTGT
jgi:hypothetical protein